MFTILHIMINGWVSEGIHQTWFQNNRLHQCLHLFPIKMFPNYQIEISGSQACLTGGWLRYLSLADFLQFSTHRRYENLAVHWILHFCRLQVHVVLQDIPLMTDLGFLLTEDNDSLLAFNPSAQGNISSSSSSESSWFPVKLALEEVYSIEHDLKVVQWLSRSKVMSFTLYEALLMSLEFCKEPNRKANHTISQTPRVSFMKTNQTDNKPFCNEHVVVGKQGFSFFSTFKIRSWILTDPFKRKWSTTIVITHLGW